VQSALVEVVQDQVASEKVASTSDVLSPMMVKSLVVAHLYPFALGDIEEAASYDALILAMPGAN